MNQSILATVSFTASCTAAEVVDRMSAEFCLELSKCQSEERFVKLAFEGIACGLEFSLLYMDPIKTPSFWVMQIGALVDPKLPVVVVDVSEYYARFIESIGFVVREWPIAEKMNHVVDCGA